MERPTNTLMSKLISAPVEPTAASAVFGPQKGASKDDVATLDASLAHFAQVIDSQLGVAVNDVPGAGAAGGYAECTRCIKKLYQTSTVCCQKLKGQNA